MKRAVLIALILVMELAYSASTATIVQADMTLDTSCNTTTNTYTELLHNGTAIVFNNSFSCLNGCANNGLECDTPAQPELFFAFAIVFSLAAFTFAYLALRIGEEYRPLQFMFLTFTVVYIAFVTYIMSGFSTLTMNTLSTIMTQSYIIGVMTVVGVVFYLMALLVIRLLGLLRFKKESGRPFKW